MSLILSSPLIMHLVWLFKSALPMDIIIVDKTVSDSQKNEHASYIWLLNNLKVVKKEKSLYSIDDYYGFFPYANEKFDIRDFESLNSNELKKISNQHQMIYITDSYGVYSNEWYQHKSISERSNLIYGGLTENEMFLTEELKKEKKLIVAEFNCIGSPTKTIIRNRFEELFHLKWTGWIAAILIIFR